MLMQKCIDRHKVQNISLRLQSVESRRYILQNILNMFPFVLQLLSDMMLQS